MTFIDSGERVRSEIKLARIAEIKIMTQMKQFYINTVQHFHAVVSFSKIARDTTKTVTPSLPWTASDLSGQLNRATTSSRR